MKNLFLIDNTKNHHTSTISSLIVMLMGKAGYQQYLSIIWVVIQEISQKKQNTVVKLDFHMP